MCISGGGPVQLWQFLLEILTESASQDMARWTGRGWEFKLLKPDEVLILAFLQQTDIIPHFLCTKSRFVEEREHITDQDVKEQKDS